MAARYGIDTSILVRLATGDPAEGYARCLRSLRRLVETDGADVLASNQVIGEAYVALQHHYGVPKGESREALASVLQSGLVRPLGGPDVLEILGSEGGCGLFDRLIADEYRRADVVTLTLDRKMAALPQARLLR
jgi:predicted nucleic acid-binding protein